MLHCRNQPPLPRCVVYSALNLHPGAVFQQESVALVFLEMLWPLNYAQELPQPIWHAGLQSFSVSLIPGEMP